MFHTFMAMPPREKAKWCVYGLALLAPGSLLILPLMLLGRRWMSRAAQPVRGAADTR